MYSIVLSHSLSQSVFRILLDQSDSYFPLVLSFPSVVEEIRSAAEQAIAPKFVKKIANMEVPEGSQARFECKVLGSPRPEVKWYKDNKEIQSNQYTSITTTPDGGSVLHFQKVFADDTGRVTVVASNTAGTKDMAADLVVQGIIGITLVACNLYDICTSLFSKQALQLFNTVLNRNKQRQSYM